MSKQNKEIIEKVNEAFNKSDTPAFLSYCTGDVAWNMVGEMTTIGKEAIQEMMKSMPDFSPNIVLTDVFATDEKGACTGTFSMPNKEGVITLYSFCDVYHFSGNKINALDSYVVVKKS